MIDDSNPDKPKHDEWKVLLVLALALFGMEIATRAFESALSDDIRHLRSLPELAKQIESREPSNETTLVVGNSLARRGIDAERLKAGLEDLAGPGVPVHLDFFVPDSSSVNEWSWGMRRYFRPGEVEVDRIILISGRRHLLDRPGNPEKNGSYFVARGDLFKAMAAEGRGEEAIRLGLGYFSRLAANRDRVRPLIGYRFLPGFEDAWPQLVVAGYETVMDRLGEAAGLWELNSLRRFLDHAGELKAELYIVAVPLPDRYELPEKAVRFLEEKGVTVIDLSTVPGVGEENFPDGYHLDEVGAEKFTDALLQRLP